MKIAVLGGGTAGCVAAAYLSKKYPLLELIHIYDSKIPTIGVGEGTLLNFGSWLKSIFLDETSQVAERCFMTKKFGSRFINWGDQNSDYRLDFRPSHKYSYHLSAEYLVQELKKHVSATYLDAHIVDLKRSNSDVTIVLKDQSEIVVDFVIDSTGFPKNLKENKEDFIHLGRYIPTNAAIIRRGEAKVFKPNYIQDKIFTGAVARPHGWIFVIPVETYTSFGYVYNSNLNSIEEVTKDFDEFLLAEEIHNYEELKQLSFPNFIDKKVFDGFVFKIGNKASFMEPLEATAIALLILSLNIMEVWPLNRLNIMHLEERTHPQNIDAINNYYKDFILEWVVFIALHYSKGSKYETPFWTHGKQCWKNCQEDLFDAKAFDSVRWLFNKEYYNKYEEVLKDSLTDDDSAVSKFNFRQHFVYEIMKGLAYHKS